MLKIFLILLLVVLAFKLYKSKIHIDFKSFFKRGFKKLDNKFGVFCYVGKQRKTEKLIQLLSLYMTKSLNMVIL